MRGVATKTPERVAEAQRLCEGCGDPLPPQRTGRQRKWCSERCRKRTLYGGTCQFCGATTNGYDGPGRAADVCKACLHARLAWSREKVIAAIRHWTDEHGGIPPRSLDWGNLGRHHPDYTPEYPSYWTVCKYCGTFNAALEAAGFEPHMRRDPDRYAGGRLDEIVARIRAGESASSIAREMGLCDQAVLQALYARGLSVRSVREQARTAA